MASMRKTSSIVGVAGSIAVAVLAQGYVAGQEYLWDGLFLYGLALVLGWRFLPRLKVRDEAAAHPTEETASLVPVLSRATMLLALATLLANLLALLLFGTDNLRTLAWVLYAASVVTAPLTVWFAAGRPRLRPLAGWSAEDVIALSLILLIGAAFRLYQLDSLPFGLWWDEAFSGLQVQRIANDAAFRPVYLQETSLHWYIMLPFYHLWGATPLSLRLSAALGGTLGVLAVTLLGRELFGRRVALIAGVLLAVMAWHVNFSRIAFNAIWSVTFDALALYFLIRGLRGGKMISFALAGSCLGLGLNMYYTSRLVPVVMVVYLAYRLAAERRHFFSRHLAGLGLFVVVALLSASPLLQFALQKPGDFGSRSSQVSMIGEVTQQQSLAPLAENLRKHLLMFHYEGDGNGRHNLPRAPMLDQITAALFALGLAMALRQIGKAEHATALTWFAIMLGGGVLSLAFEAPQGLRTIDETAMVAILASLPLAALWGSLPLHQLGQLRLTLPPGRPGDRQLLVPVAAMTIGVLLLGVGVLNYQRYFVQQASDYQSWSVFSTAETEIASQIKALGPSYDVLLGETFTNHPTIEFLTGRKNYQKFEPASHLPLRGIRNVALFLEPHHTAALSQIRQLYPQAETRIVRSPEGGLPILLVALVKQSDILSLQGLEGSYYANAEWEGEPVLEERNASPRLEMRSPRVPKPPFSATWHGTLAVPEYGRYLFRLEGPQTAEIYLDEHRLAVGGQQEDVVLATGLHSLRISAVFGEPTPISVLWQPPKAGQLMPLPKDLLFSPPVASRGLLGSYYGNRHWEGEPAFQQIDPDLNRQVHLLPLPRPYSVEWRGKVEVPRDGNYRFATESADTSWVYLDEKLVVTNEGANRQLREGAVQLEAGVHDLRVRFYDESDHTFIRVYWTPPGGQRELLPTERLFPPQGSYRPTIESADPAPAAAQPNAPASIAPGTVAADFLGSVTGEGRFSQPRDVAVGLDGRFYVADSGNKRVHIFSPQGAPAGQLEGEFVEPFGVVVAPGGQLLVLDSKGTEPILMFNPDGKVLSRMGRSANMYSPRGMSVDPTGAIYVADTGRSRVVKLSSTGQMLAEFRGQGQMAQPVSVAVAGDGTLYVADADKHLLLVLDAKDTVLRSWPLRPSTTFDAPHLAVGPRGELYVTDPPSGLVRVCDPEGRSLGELGSPGSGDSQFNLPTGVRIDALGQLWVVDTGNRRIQRWGIR